MLGTDTKQGLRSEQVDRCREQYGLNELASAPPEPLWRKFFRQFNDLVVWLLVVAALVSGVMGEWTDATAIIAIVLLNALLGFVQEEKASRALAALQKLAAPAARVLRDNRLQTVGARELVPGDLIDLDAGDHIPADSRLVEAFAVRVQESALTGESTPVDKDARLVLAETVPLADRRNMVYMGTVMAGGKGRAVVVTTGMNTELGRIAGLLEDYKPDPTPLQRKLAELGRALAAACQVLSGGGSRLRIERIRSVESVQSVKLWFGSITMMSVLSKPNHGSIKKANVMERQKRHSITSAYTVTSLPVWPDCPLSRHPTISLTLSVRLVGHDAPPIEVGVSGQLP